jgi:chemotaxis family two-component system sensor kinase Cph1
MLPVMVFIWLLLGMVYLDHFLKPFDRLIPWLVPWRAPTSSSGLSRVEDRLAIMQGQLDGSNRVAHYAFLTMITTFALFCIYLTLVYQQKQRRARDNELLSLKNQEIARRNEFIRYISATIGHEFKNNLGRIKRRIDLLHDLPQDVKARIDDNMEKLFADIDIFKRISDERETGLINFEKVYLKDMLVTLTGQYSDFAEFTFQDKTSPPAIFASPTLLRTVFENLIDNAIKYKKPDQERARVVLSCSEDIDRDRRYVTLSFRDKGIGMDEYEADRCFYTSKSSRGGWGQGLYFAKYVVGLHAGKIRVGKAYTALGNGTEIIMNLPFVEESL